MFEGCLPKFTNNNKNPSKELVIRYLDKKEYVKCFAVILILTLFISALLSRNRFPMRNYLKWRDKDKLFILCMMSCC